MSFSWHPNSCHWHHFRCSFWLHSCFHFHQIQNKFNFFCSVPKCALHLSNKWRQFSDSAICRSHWLKYWRNMLEIQIRFSLLFDNKFQEYEFSLSFNEKNSHWILEISRTPVISAGKKTIAFCVYFVRSRVCLLRL